MNLIDKFNFIVSFARLTSTNLSPLYNYLNLFVPSIQIQSIIKYLFLFGDSLVHGSRSNKISHKGRRDYCKCENVSRHIY